MEEDCENLDNSSFEEVVDETDSVLALFDPDGTFSELSNDDPRKYLFYKYYSEYLGKNVMNVNFRRKNIKLKNGKKSLNNFSKE